MHELTIQYKLLLLAPAGTERERESESVALVQEVHIEPSFVCFGCFVGAL